MRAGLWHTAIKPQPISLSVALSFFLSPPFLSPSSCALNRPLNHPAQALWLVDLSAWLNSHFHHVLHRRVTERERGREMERQMPIREVSEPNQMGFYHTDDDRHLDHTGWGAGWYSTQWWLVWIAPESLTYGSAEYSWQIQRMTWQT